MSLDSHNAATTDAQRSHRLANLLWVLPFLLLFWVDLWHHVLWFDEINAWAIVAGSTSVKQLFYFVHVEAHPWLWYFVLYVPSRFTPDPAAMKWVEAAIGTAIYLVIGMLSPFNRVQKLLLFASYYIVFEYTVMSRMYGMMLLFALLFVWRRVRRPESVVGNLLLLGAVANTDATGIVLSGAFLLQYAYDLYIARRVFGWTRQQVRSAAVAAVGYLAMLGFSVHSMLPSKDISWQASGRIGSEALQARRIVESIGNLTASAWWPIAHDFPHHFWGTDAVHTKWLLALVPFVLYAYWRTLRGNRSLLLLVGLATAFGMFFADVVYAGRVRHWGIVVIAFVAALWMKTAAEGESKRWSRWAYALLGLGAVAGVTATVGTWLHPFSQAKNVADWIRANEPADVALVGERDFSFGSVAEQLQRPVYYMECGCVDTMKLFTHERDTFPQEELPARLSLAMQKMHAGELVLVNFVPMPETDLARLHAASLEATKIVQFEGSEDPHENFYLYRIVRVGE